MSVRRAGGCGVCEESFDCRLSAETRICSVFIAEKKKHFDIRSRLTLLTTDYNLCFMDEESEAWRSKSQSSGGMGGPAPRHHRIPPSSAPEQGPRLRKTRASWSDRCGAEGGACPQGSRSVPVKPPGSPGPAAAPAWTVQLCEPSCLQAEETVRGGAQRSGLGTARLAHASLPPPRGPRPVCRCPGSAGCRPGRADCGNVTAVLGAEGPASATASPFLRCETLSGYGRGGLPGRPLAWVQTSIPHGWRWYKPTEG